MTATQNAIADKVQDLVNTIRLTGPDGLRQAASILESIMDDEFIPEENEAIDTIAGLCRYKAE